MVDLDFTRFDCKAIEGDCMTELKPSESKPLVQSITFYGILLTLLPELADGLNEVINSGVLPDKVEIVVRSVGAGIALVGRLFAKVKISGLFK